MPMAENPDHRADAGFVRAYDPRAARRQFQVSIVLIVVLGLAAIVLGMLTQLGRPLPSSFKASSPHIAEALLDFHG